MKLEEQQAIRSSTARVMIDWANNRQPPFTGENPDNFKDAITAAHLVADEAKLDFQRWIDAARRTGVSWTDIGEALGISKQAAQQRFGISGTIGDAAANEGEKVVRFGATAFNEMRIMRAEGNDGNELVDTGPLTLTFRSTDHNWEYCRRIAGSSNTGKMAAAGWTYVSSWLPFHYYKRRILGT